MTQKILELFVITQPYQNLNQLQILAFLCNLFRFLDNHKHAVEISRCQVALFFAFSYTHKIKRNNIMALISRVQMKKISLSQFHKSSKMSQNPVAGVKFDGFKHL